MTGEDFFTEYQRLINSQPYIPTHNLNCQSCELGDYNYHSKNLAYAFDNVSCEDSCYIYDSYMAVNCFDGDYCIESQSCYESVDVFKCFNGWYLEYSARLRDSYYCYNCNDSHDLFGCVHLNHKSFCIFNKQYSKEEYFEKIKELKNKPAKEILAKLEELKTKYPVTQTNITHTENCDYCNHVHYSKNLYLCFDVVGSEDCGYLFDCDHCRNSWDLTNCHECELCYECTDSAHLYNCQFVDYSDYCRDSAYLYNCHNLKNCFGCVGLSHKEYCILNRQYTKEGYLEKLEEIKKNLRQVVPQIALP